MTQSKSYWMTLKSVVLLQKIANDFCSYLSQTSVASSAIKHSRNFNHTLLLFRKRIPVSIDCNIGTYYKRVRVTKGLFCELCEAHLKIIVDILLLSQRFKQYTYMDLS